MTSLLISLVVWVLSQGAPNRISERNRLKMEAERAFGERRYATAAALYQHLAESAWIPEPAVLFDQAQACFVLGDTARARQQYNRLVRTPDKPMAAAALSQLGVLACRRGDSTEALTYFRQALEVLPSYELARYNYELVRKTMPPTPSKKPRLAPAPGQSEPTRNQPPSPQPSRENRALASEKREDFLRKLRQYDLTQEKARMLLDAMRAEEIQYIQQRSRATGDTGIEMTQTW